MTDASEVVRFMDFSTSLEPVRFRIAPDDFEAVPEISLDTMAELAKMAQIQRSANGHVDFDDMRGRFYDLFDGILSPDSAALIRARSAKGHPHPIGMITLITKVLPWLMEVYGLRPTQRSSESSDGSDTTSTSSTDGVSNEE